MPESRPFTILLLGCPIHSANRGVSALGLAALANLRKAFPDARLIVGNSGLAKEVSVQAGTEAFEVETSWIRPSESLRPRSGTRYLDILRRLQRWIPKAIHRWVSNRTFEQLREADVVLDICGGDSFAEIYGLRQFQSQVAIKQLALAMGKPLVLLPQSFGPFESDEAVKAARRIIRGSLLAASRDLDGVEQLRRLLSPHEHPRLASCPDVAFTLEPVPVETDALPRLLRRRPEGVLFGLNVSGLLHSRSARLPLSVDYQEVIGALVQWMLSHPRSGLLLVPHVFGASRPQAPSDGRLADGSDLDACRLVHEEWSTRFPGRIECLESPLEAARLKFVIGHCDFFIGARMHSCVAAASQCVPTAVLAYSPKARGVFGMIGAEGMVVDLRASACGAAVQQISGLYQVRDQVRTTLLAAIPRAGDAVRAFFAETLRSALLQCGTLRPACGTERQEARSLREPTEPVAYER